MSHTLAIITVIYENYNVFDDFLKSLRNQKSKAFHLFIADVSVHRQKIDLSGIASTVLEVENKGYADGVNYGLQEAEKQGITQYCVMNYDTFFKEDFVENILTSMNLHPGSLIGGKIYYAPGYEYYKDRYTKNDKGKVIWYAGGTILWDHAFTPHRGVDEVDAGQFNSLQETDFITGCLMCFDKSILEKVGPWDPSYFLYYEDADYSVRAAQKGIKLIYDPSIVIWHKVSQSTEGSGSKLHQKYQEKNRLKFGLKYAPFRTKIHLLKNFLFPNTKIK